MHCAPNWDGRVVFVMHCVANTKGARCCFAGGDKSERSKFRIEGKRFAKKCKLPACRIEMAASNGWDWELVGRLCPDGVERKTLGGVGALMRGSGIQKRASLTKARLVFMALACSLHCGREGLQRSRSLCSNPRGLKPRPQEREGVFRRERGDGGVLDEPFVVGDEVACVRSLRGGDDQVVLEVVVDAVEGACLPQVRLIGAHGGGLFAHAAHASPSDFGCRCRVVLVQRAAFVAYVAFEGVCNEAEHVFDDGCGV